MRRKQITGADLLSELHSYNGNDKRYSESKVTEAAKAVDNGNYQESETAAEYAMKKLKAHYGVEDQDNNEDIAQLAQSGLQKLEQYYGTRNQMSSVNTIQSGIQEGQNRYFNEDSELPASGRIIQTMDDRAIEEALKIAKGRMKQSDEAYTEKFGRSPETTIEHSRQAAQIDRYQNELDRRNAEREQNTYYKKREDALNALTDEQRSNLEEYVNATREMNNTSKISGAMGGTSMITENLQNEAIDKKNAAKKALEDSGIKNLDVLAQYMGEIQDEENTIRINDSIKKDVDKHPVLAGTAYSALDVAMSPAAGLTAAVETLKRPYYADPSAPVNTNSDAYALTNFSNATESAVSDKIDNKYGQFAYGVGMSTAKSAYSVALGSEIVGGLGLTGKAAKTVGNIVTLPEFGASAYATTLQQDQANGISTENSIKHATAAGINEMLFEVVSLDHAWDILHRSGKTAAKEAIVSTLAQAGIEGTEEGFTDIANAIADNIINGDQSEYNRNVQNYVSMGYTEQEAKDRASKDFMGEIAQDVLAGAISGGIMGGITNTANAVNYHKLGAHIETTTELKNNVLDVAEQMDESTTAKQIVEEKGRENLNAEDLGAIAQSMAEESGKDIQDVLTERFVELNETKQQARKDAKEIIKAVTTPSEEVTNEENDARTQKFEANPNLSTVYAETLEGKHTAVNDAINNVQSSYHYAQMEKKGRESHTGVTRAVVKSTGEKQIVIDVQNVSGNHATVRMSNGTLKDLSEIEIPDRNLQQLYNFSTTMDTATVANTLINNWDNEEVAPYVRASAVFYNAGKLGTSSFESLMNNPKNAQLVMSVNNPATLKAMYTLGQNNSQRAEVAPVQQQKNINGSEQKEKAGKVVDLRTDKADGRMVRVAEHVAKKTGLEITLNDSLEHGENGHFSQALSRIALSSTSHNEYETLIHELNEWANTYNPEGMRKVMDAVLDYAQTKEGATYLSDRIQKYYDTYKRVESDKTYEGSADEFVFDYLAGVFSTEEGVKDFSNYMTEENISQKEQKSILETVADFFKELYDKIVSFLDDHVLSETAKKGLEADAEKAQEIRDMVMNVWQEAEENYHFDSTTPENNEKFSLKTTVEETKDLIAVHNLNEEKLSKTLELGGFPMPSIAITKSNIGHNGYGEISVLFNKDTIDPKNSDNKVFGADAYTTRFPQIDYKVNEDELHNLAEKLGMSTSMLDSNAFNGKDVYRAAESLKQLPDVRNKFIKENNIKVEPVLRMPQAHPSFLTKDNIKNFIVGNNITLEQIVNDSNVREQFLEKVQETAGTGRIAAKWYQRIKDELEGMADNEEIYNILAPAWNDNLDIIYGKAKPVEDAYSYLDGVNNAIKEHMDEFDLYALELAQPVIGEAGIYNGKDPYTKSGYLKSFEELHYDYNLENLVKAMKSKGVKNEEDSFVTDVNNVRAAVSKEFKSIDDIKKAEERLQDLTPEEIEEKYSDARELFKNIVNTLSSIQNSSSGNSLIDNENAAHNIVDAVKGGLTENKVKKELQKYYKNVSDQTVQDVITLAKELRDIPVKYFEAKPQRAVSLDEVMAVAVPNNVSEDLMNKLNERHIPTYIYEHDNTENRKEIVNNIAEEKNIKFSVYVDTNILEKAQKFKEENYKNFERVKVIDITERIKNDVKRLAGFDATGYEIYSNTDTYRHIEKRHGENGEHDHSMADLRDVALMGFVLKNYDNAEIVLNNNGEIDTTSAFSSKDGSPAKMIKFSKKILDTMYVVLAVPENKYKKLWVISEYKQKNEDTSQSSHDNKTLPPTPKANTDTVSSNKIISQKTKKATKKYSINVDSTGKELTEAQKAYFKNSKVVDNNGNLLVMYHGTPRGEFTVFKPGLQFFTQNKEYADKYQEPSASSRTAGKQVTNQKTYEVYLNIKKPFDIRDPKIKKTFVEDYVKGGYALGINPYVPYKDTTKTGLPSWEETDNIYEFLEDNDLLDEYDGIVVDEGGYEGENGKTMYRGISYITFNSNQVKNVDNLNPTENNDIRYSIDIDDSFFDALYGEPSKHETEMSSIIQEGFESLKNVEVNERMMHKIAYAIKKENKSTYDIDKLTSNLTKVFAYLKEHQNADYNDMIRIVQEVAKPVIEESTDVDPYEQQAYKDVRDYVKGLDIRLNDEQKAEVAYYYGSYEKFRKMNFGNFNFTDKGTYLDNLWTEIVDNSYQMLDYDVSSADQPMALVDMLNQLKPAKKNIFGMDKEQAAYDLALDIYRRFFVEQAQDAANKKVYEKTDRLIVRQQEYRKRVKAAYDESLAKLRTAETEKRKQQAERYEEKIADLKSAQQAALANADKKAAKKYQDDIVSWNRWLTRATQRADRTEQRMLELKAATRNNALAKRRNQEMSSMRERIKKNANGIISYFNTNTDKKHVPEALKDSVAKFITSIDFVSERANPDSNATMAWRESLNQMYRKLSDRNAAVEGNYEDIFNALMDQADGNKSTLLSDMSDFINANENVRITDMNANQLKQLDELITRLKRTITTVNQLYVNKRTNDARKLGADTIAELDQKKDKKLHANRTVQAVENLLDVNMMDARSYFYRLGDTAGSIYDGLRTAFNDRVWLLKEAQTYMENALDGINTKDWTGDNAKVHTFMIRGKELQMTTAQIMSLYELRKRNQALLHMKVGGIRPKDITTAKKNVDISKSKLGKEVISRVKPIQLTEYDIDHVICSVLTPEQIKIADAMQQFMANNCADWGNKTTMMMNGYKRFGVKSYFPIKVDGNSVDTKDQTAYWATQNNSFTKQTRERAANALIVDDIFDVFTKHVTDMATYSTFTAPLSDAMKWFNHRNVEFDGDIAADTDSVQRQIELTYGKEYLEYFKKLIKDINAESVNGIESQIASTLVSKMKAASVGGNLRVAIQQPTAYIRAAAVMNPKYMAQAVFKKSAMKKAKENSAITQWKSWGYFETSIGQSMKSVITGQQSLKENLVEKSMILAQLGDDVTWGYLWNACEVEIKDKHPDVKYDSKEFIKMVAERFDEIVDQTQVVDSVLHRSQIMRSQDKLVQMATAFMAEPTKSYNLLVNAVRDASEKKSKSAMKRLGRVVTAYTATQVMNAAIVAVIDATRDLEDDDKTFWDKYIENLKGNIVDNMNPISMIPFAKDIVSIFQGYDISRLDMQGISKLYAGANNMRKYITDPDYREKHTFYDVAKETARGVSLVTGIPGFNVLRDIESLYHAVTGKWLGGIIRSNTRQYQRSVDALLDGNTEEYNSIMQELSDKNVEEDKIDSGIMSELKKRYTAGEMEKSTVENILKDQFEMDDNDIYYKLKKWENGSDWTKYSDFYSAMDNAYETGKINDRDKIKAEIDDLKKHGVKEETIKSQITEKYKQIYLEAKKNGNYADLKNLLISAYMMCGDSHSEAMKKIDNWSKQKKS